MRGEGADHVLRVRAERQIRRAHPAAQPVRVAAKLHFAPVAAFADDYHRHARVAVRQHVAIRGGVEGRVIVRGAGDTGVVHVGENFVKRLREGGKIHISQRMGKGEATVMLRIVVLIPFLNLPFDNAILKNDEI